jgi:hypothetical protein
MKKIKKYVIFFLIISAILVAAFYNGLVVRRYEIKTGGESEGVANIVVLADLHNTSYGGNQKRLIVKIERQKPDLILLIGDIIDDFSQTAAAEALLSGIDGMAPVYYVTGNHEFWTGRAEEITELTQSCGVTVLRNETVDIEINGMKITLCGTDDPDVLHYSDEEKYKAMQSADELLTAFAGLDEAGFNILMAHRPERIEQYKKYPFDLVLSGHAHGGQVRIPLIINGLFAPDQGWFPKYAGGKYKHEELTHIVSRGLSLKTMPRIFNPPEVVVVELESG